MSQCSRRQFAAVAASCLLGRPPRARAAWDGRAQWNEFRARFLDPSGRVVDTGNGGISHSEGQAYGMLFAATFDDPASFDLIHGWTAQALARSSDALHAWRWVPGAHPPVQDRNNASDADLLIALALARAGARWQRQTLVAAAAAIARDVLRLLVVHVGGRCVLLPGAAGFTHAAEIVTNLSYAVFPALRALAALQPDPAWAHLEADALETIAAARFGPWGLPPDWLAINRTSGRLVLAPGWPPRFSYDAIRIPLYLSWGGLMLPSLRDALLRATASRTESAPDTAYNLPTSIDLVTGAVAPGPSPAGFRAVGRLLAPGRPAPPMLAEAESYYSAALVLLAGIARAEAPGAP